MSTAPLTIGVFDSGVGGLTVLRALREQMPEVQFIYLGDMARLPYGTKSKEAVVAYTLRAAQALVNQGIQALVVACSTASSCAVPALKEAFPLRPVIDVIRPTVAYVKSCGAKEILVLATPGTVASHMYKDLFAESASNIHVYEVATPLLVTLAEEGWSDSQIIDLALNRYLQDFAPLQPLDTVILGCTHFPLHMAAIQAYFGPQVRIIDTAIPTASFLGAQRGAFFPGCHLKRNDNGLNVPLEGNGSVRYLVTDSPERFRSVASLFLGLPIAQEQVELINL